MGGARHSSMDGNIPGPRLLRIRLVCIDRELANAGRGRATPAYFGWLGTGGLEVIRDSGPGVNAGPSLPTGRGVVRPMNSEAVTGTAKSGPG